MNRSNTRIIIIRVLAVYAAWLLLDFILQYNRGTYKVRNYQITDIFPVTICYAWIVFHNLVLFKNLVLNRKKYFLYVAGLLGFLYGFSALYNLVVPSTEFARTLTYMLWYNFFIAVVGLAFFLAWNYFQERRNSLILTALNREAELKQLKLQLNPHFLFNSLNNIYSYNLENNNRGNDLILRLSNLMRFIVETSDTETILLREELEFIDNYVAFEEERLGHRCEIVFVRQLSNPDLRIPPLILFPFIENAFKHGTTTLAKNRIEISLTMKGGHVEFTVKNSIRANNAVSTKTGLSNIQKRLELLYPGSHRLSVKKTEGSFTVNLDLTVNEN